MKRSIVICMCMALLLSCNRRPTGSTLDLQAVDPGEDNVAGAVSQIMEEDTTIYTMEYNTAALDDYENYFRQNNRYADWDKGDKRIVFPMKNHRGEPVRSLWTIPVSFPPR